MILNLKKARQLLFLLLFVSVVSKQTAQDIQWEKTYGGLQAEYLTDVVPTADYGYIIAGSSLSRKSGNKTDIGKGDLDFWLWKMKENGDVEWQKSYGGSGADFLQAIKYTPDGGYILAGTTTSVDSGQQYDTSKIDVFGQNDFCVIKIDAKGVVEWEQRYGGNGQDDLVTINLTTDGGYILGGSSDSSVLLDQKNEISTNPNAKSQENRGNMDYWILKIDAKGKTQWQKTYGGDYADLLRAVTPALGGGYLVGGYSNSPQSGDKTNENYGDGGDFWILKLKENGTIEWQQTIGGNKDDQLFAMLTTDNGYLLGGNSNSGATGNKSSDNQNGADFWIVNLDSKGTIGWQKTYNYGETDILTAMVLNKDKTILVAGYSPSTKNESKRDKKDKGIDDYIAIKIDAKGEVLWEQKVGSDGVDILKKAIETRDGGYILAGTSAVEEQKDKKVLGTSLQNLTTENQFASDTKNKLNQQVAETVANTNNEIKKTLDDNINKTKTYLGVTENFPVSIKTNSDALGIGSLLGNDKQTATNTKPLPPSGDKTKAYGSNDFWVVKLKDKSKKVETPKLLEAIPNPANSFTNIIVGYDFVTGTATVTDMMGRQLQNLNIDSRTIPIDLSSYPAGVYIVNVVTANANESIKVIKGNKN